MRIDTQHEGRVARVVVAGRLDAAWTDTFSARMDELVRAGADTILVDAAELSFLSSLGIRCLITLSQRLRAVGGSFRLTSPSEPVRQVIELSRLSSILLHATAEATRPPEGDAFDGVGFKGVRRELSPGATARVESIAPSSAPHAWRGGASLLFIGHAALAGAAAEAAGRFGECIAIGGALAVQPTDSPEPDFMDQGTGSMPAWVHSGLDVSGAMRHFAHIESQADGHAEVSEIASACVAHANGPVAMVIAGLCAGLVGATARVSPDRWTQPLAALNPNAVRQRMRFTGEPMWDGESVLIAGIAGAATAGLDGTAPFGIGLRAHLHGLACSFRALPRSATPLQPIARALMLEQPIRGIVHLIDDARADGAGRSAVRRACVWWSPMAKGSGAR